MRLRVQGLVLIAALSVAATFAQELQYLDPGLPATERAADLIHRMRLEAVLTSSSELKGEEMQVS